jgi:hypothetical protein
MRLQNNDNFTNNQVSEVNFRRQNEPCPRCLAVLPNNIEELICQFRMQDKGSHLGSQIGFQLKEKSDTDLGELK